MAQIELRSVSKHWGPTVAVDGMNLALENGEFVAILGPSGCGKSTTLFLLAGIYAPTSGDICFDGARINDVEPRDRNVGIVFQSYALYPNMTVLKNLLFPLRFTSVKSEEALRQAKAIAELVQIEELLERHPSQLSGGQQQRVALARALIKKPNLLLLDEPLSNLDATLRLTMRGEIKRIQRELRVTTILVTHDQVEATTMADRIICMNAGRVEQIGTPENLYRKPDRTFVATFVGSPPINLIDGHVRNGSFAVGQKRIPLSGSCRDADVTLGLRPELISVAETGLPSEITNIEPMGREILYTAQSEIGLFRFLEATPQPRMALEDRVRLHANPEDALFFEQETGSRIEGLSLAAFS
ncbi:MAG: ABC transporter ATP-binding protein [Rhodobacteraceae bacterium]|nr:ABC transporter ATP-binding protein [Paracoccaceae bacterium]